MKNGGDFEFFKRNFGFLLRFNVFEIVSVTKKYLDFSNLKWRIEYGGLNA